MLDVLRELRCAAARAIAVLAPFELWVAWQDGQEPAATELRSASHRLASRWRALPAITDACKLVTILLAVAPLRAPGAADQMPDLTSIAEFILEEANKTYSHHMIRFINLLAGRDIAELSEDELHALVIAMDDLRYMVVDFRGICETAHEHWPQVPLGDTRCDGVQKDAVFLEKERAAALARLTPRAWRLNAR
jgi:hypothetical protein